MKQAEFFIFFCLCFFSAIISMLEITALIFLKKLFLRTTTNLLIAKYLLIYIEFGNEVLEVYPK